MSELLSHNLFRKWVYSAYVQLCTILLENNISSTFLPNSVLAMKKCPELVFHSFFKSKKWVFGVFGEKGGENRETNPWE